MNNIKEGIYEKVISDELEKKLKILTNYEYTTEKIDFEEAKVMLSKYIGEVTRKALDYIRDNDKPEKEINLIKQIEACNKVIKVLTDISSESSLEKYKISEKAEVLLSIYSKLNSVRNIKRIKEVRPSTSIAHSSLFTGSKVEPSMISEIKKEIKTCDSIDMIVSFIKWSGLRMIIEDLKEFTKNDDHKLRIITTSYMKASDYKAIEELSKLPNTEVKISYDTNRTRLHAKAYFFKRETEFSTAYIGSSNLSNPAMTSGLEWNMKVAEKDSFDIINKFRATFEMYWNDSEFELFNVNNEQNREYLKESLSKNISNKNDFSFIFDIKPYFYQKEILEKLSVERDVYGRNKNLVVAATGVGKTIISAFDYKRFVKNNPNKENKLLFIAHKEEILKQSIDTFRAILKDYNFGELMVSGRKPNNMNHLFLSIQSFNSKKMYNFIDEDFYDFIVVDEFHHSTAKTYQKLLNYFNPKILLGLTATPERMDGANIVDHFDGYISSEMRLEEAINRKLLSPFQYFCVTDNIDLSKLKWSKGGYDKTALSNVYTTNDMRVSLIVKSLKKYTNSIEDIKGLGFCVSIEHADFMAKKFNEIGIKSIAMHSKKKQVEREAVKDKLNSGEITFIFVVDMYNEGVDIPDIDTILFLRPTESLTIFLQQLGRGLRLSDNKECLTVLDFVGQAHKKYNFEKKFKALIGSGRVSVENQIKNDFISLPKGCYIHLEKQAKEYVLRSINQAKNNKARLIDKIMNFKDYTDNKIELTINNFLNYYDLTIYEFYGRSGDRNFSRMKVEAGISNDYNFELEKKLTKKIKNLFHLNSKKLIDFSINLFKNGIINDYNEEETLMINMLYYSLFNKKPLDEEFKNQLEGINEIIKCNEFRNEIIEILEYKLNHLIILEKDIKFKKISPIELHCNYTTDQILAGFNYYNELKKPSFREGVKFLKDYKMDIFLITLNKSEKDYSESTLYDDYAINDILFHWQSQSRTSVESKTGQRYINHEKNGSKIALFVRNYKKENGLTSPYTFIGLANYVSHYGNRPISFTWKLDNEMPSFVARNALKVI